MQSPPASPRFKHLTSVVLAVALGCITASAAEPDFTPLLKEHARRYPEWQVQDCYKLVFQAVLGSEHAAVDEATARRWLEQEVAGLGAGPAEPLVDPISPDGRIVRMHLRPFVEQHGDLGKLAAAFVETAKTFRGSKNSLAAVWAEVIRLAARGKLPFSAGDAQRFGAAMAADGFPTVHHSKEYNEHYRPAYRVIAREYLAGLVPGQ
ncbi:MAG TPA: hypothetical protein VG936_01545 [Lacunisphaera sp.]|nr:hypothetical protein [Lacunisphaera sp.]